VSTELAIVAMTSRYYYVSEVATLEQHQWNGLLMAQLSCATIYNLRIADLRLPGSQSNKLLSRIAQYGFAVAPIVHNGSIDNTPDGSFVYDSAVSRHNIHGARLYLFGFPCIAPRVTLPLVLPVDIEPIIAPQRP
jgi:hypothetical protein